MPSSHMLGPDNLMYISTDQPQGQAEADTPNEPERLVLTILIDYLAPVSGARFSFVSPQALLDIGPLGIGVCPRAILLN